MLRNEFFGRAIVACAAVVFAPVLIMCSLALPALALGEGEGGEADETPKVSIEDCALALDQDTYTYDGAEKVPGVTVTYTSSEEGAEPVELAEGTDYTVEGGSATNAGAYTITVTGVGSYEGTATARFTIKPKAVKPTIKLGKTSYVYNGKAKKPAATVSFDDSAVSSGDYDVTYASGRKNVGAYKVTVKAKGNYTGTKAATFKIVPKGTAFSAALERGERSFRACWTTQKAQTSGYQLQYSKDKAFKTGVKTATLAKNTYKAATVKKLAQKSTYFARIRTYKTVGGKKYVSAWSAKKKVRTYANDLFVVTIDAGHGGIDSGASGCGRLEKRMTLKLAKYLQEELENYDNVAVYMTRSTDKTVALGSRVPYAVENDSDLFISLHLDWSGAGLSGATALVPGAHYHKELSWSSQQLGSMILDELHDRIGFKNRGLLKRFQGGKRYPNGTRKDYYRVIRQGVEYGIMSILMEHGFIDSYRDISKMNTNSKLRKVARADAIGIAKYFGLSSWDWSESYKAQGKRTKMVSRYWLLKGGKYYYVQKNEKLLKNTKKTINGVKYVFDKTGVLVSDSSGKKAPKP